jgi:hypothetical protein
MERRATRGKEEAQRIRTQSSRYTLVKDVFYHRGYTLPLLKCISRPETEYFLEEIHEGVCSSHLGGRMLVHKAVRVVYYWQTMNRDSSEMVKHCDKCQRFAKVDRSPPTELSSISSPWPFAQWGLTL